MAGAETSAPYATGSVAAAGTTSRCRTRRACERGSAASRVTAASEEGVASADSEDREHRAAEAVELAAARYPFLRNWRGLPFYHK